MRTIDGVPEAHGEPEVIEEISRNPVERPNYLSMTTECEAQRRSNSSVNNHIDSLVKKFPAPIEPYPVEVVDDPFDLKNLRYKEPTPDGKRMLTEKIIREVLQRMNVETFIRDVLESCKLFVLGIGTGGTIAMKENEEGRRVPDKDFKSVLTEADPRLLERYTIDSLDAYGIDSSEMTIGDEGDLVIAMCHIWKNMDSRLKKVFAGFLVVHGTDTMPQSGAHMLAMLGQNMPFNIVHTGAQKPIRTANNDARINVPDALYQLEAQYRNDICDATTVMGRIANLTAGIKKISDFHAKAMHAYMHEQVHDLAAGADPARIKLPDWLRRRPPRGLPFNPVVYRGPNRIGEEVAEMEENPAEIIIDIRYKGWLAVMATTYGAGTFEPPIAKLIGQEVRRQNLALFAVSPVNADPDLAIYDASQELIAAGAKPLYMTIEMARAKLMRWFAIFFQQESKIGGSHDVPFNIRMRSAMPRLEEYMASQLVGEIPTKWSKRILKPEVRVDS